MADALTLMQAIVWGSVCSAEYAIAKDPGAVTRVSDEGEYPLHRAIFMGNLKICRLLLEKGSGVDGTTSKLPPFLAHAIEHDKPEIVDLLLERGANVNLPIELHTYALFTAVGLKQQATVERLLKAGALVNFLIPNGYHGPLHCAVVDGEFSIVEALLQYGADPNLAQVEGYRPLDYASGGYEYERSRAIRMTTLLVRYGANITRSEDGTIILPEPLLCHVQTLLALLALSSVRTLKAKSPIRCLELDIFRRLKPFLI